MQWHTVLASVVGTRELSGEAIRNPKPATVYLFMHDYMGHA